MKIDMYINRFLRWYLKKTHRNCAHCAVYDAENKKCKIFNCSWFSTDFCTRWCKERDNK